MTEILLYKTPNNQVKLEVLIKNETIWLSQKQISELFNVKIPAISKHLKNIFQSGELDENMVVSKMEITTQHGAIKDKQQIKEVTSYNLDFAEFQAKTNNLMYQKDWIEKLHKFLMLNDREVLQNAGKITAQVAKELAHSEYEKYKVIQDKLYMSDFDNIVKKLEDKEA